MGHNPKSVLLFVCFAFLLHQVLKLELKQIREQQDLLFRFMNFLKQEGAVHVLQFCLAVGECVPSTAGQKQAGYFTIRYSSVPRKASKW